MLNELADGVADATYLTIAVGGLLKLSQSVRGTPPESLIDRIAPRLRPARRARWVALGMFEVAVALLAVTSGAQATHVAPLITTLGFIGALLWARKHDVRVGCGCTGGRSRGESDLDASLVRAALLAAGALVGLLDARALLPITVSRGLGLLGFLLLLAAVSPESWAHIGPCGRQPVLTRASRLRRVVNSRAFQVMASHAAASPRPSSHRVEGCSDVFSFESSSDLDTLLVFTVSTTSVHGEFVRVGPKDNRVPALIGS